MRSENSAKKYTPPGQKGKVVMLAFGQTHQQMLELTKPRVQKVLSLPVTSITSFEHFPQAKDVFDIKLSLLQHFKCPILFIDTDVVLFDWDWQEIAPGVPNFVPNKMHRSWAGTRAIQTLLNEYPCINSGVWFCPPTFSSVFSDALRIKNGELKDFPYALGDQTSLALALKRSRTPVYPLPEAFNVQLSPGEERAPKKHEYAIHLVGQSIPTPVDSPSLDKKLLRVQEYCRNHPLAR
jgi:hypothetical protein